MTDPVVVIELTLNGTPLFGEDGNGCRWAFWFRDGFNNVPTLRGVDVTVPHKTGRTRGSRKADVLGVPLSGWLIAPEGDTDDSRSAFRTSMTTLQTLLASTAVVELEALLEDGSTATIDVAVKPPVLVREKPAGLAAELDIDLESITPSWVITPAGS